MAAGQECYLDSSLLSPGLGLKHVECGIAQRSCVWPMLLKHGWVKKEMLLRHESQSNHCYLDKTCYLDMSCFSCLKETNVT